MRGLQKMKCPHCGTDVKARQEIGMGTRRGLNCKLNENRKFMLSLFTPITKLSTLQVLNKIQNSGVRRITKRGAGWNYHTVQADLSLLVGGKHLEMTRPTESFTEEGYETTPVPLYSLNLNKKIEKKVKDIFDWC
jgi:hypothetical protein